MRSRGPAREVQDPPPLTRYEASAVAALPIAPRTTVCRRSCKQFVAFEVSELEVSEEDIVRWWKCSACGSLLPLDVVAREARP